ncbi:MAG: zinc-binding dehydrogenase [Burkholderiaceae bacterium]
MTTLPDQYLQLRSEITADARLKLSLAAVPMPVPGADEVLVRVQAAPINPSDMGLLFGAGDLATARNEGSAERPVLVADVPQAAMRGMAARVGQAMPVGNEGAGVVVAAGASEAAQALMGRTVAMLGGDMYAEYRCLNVAQCMALPESVSAREGASCFVNPLTALSMPETMRMEGHKALVHTAAASNLGQMLNRICIADGVPLVNIVRKPEQAAILREIGATHVLDSTAPDFMKRLIDALAETGATIAFDAIGGGPLAGQILVAMEAAASRGQTYSRYGSASPKQVYVYGRLDLSPTTIPPAVGMAWGVGGYLLTYFLQKIGSDGRRRLRERVLAELGTTFASRYSHEISLSQALDIDTARAYNAKHTGEKYLIRPTA